MGTSREESLRLERLLGIPPLIRVNGKRPIDPNWTTGPREAPSEWRRRLHKHEGNLGAVTGAGLLVIDADLYHEGAEESLDELHERGLPRDTITVITGGGGRHLYYRTDVRIACGPLAGFPGIDVKADGGYVVVPPSIHRETGRAYEWEHGWTPEDLPPAELPAHMLDLLTLLDRSETPEAGELDERDEAAVNLLIEHLGGHSPREHGTYIEVTRPGKEARLGGSATVGAIGRGVTKVWSSNWPGLPAGVYSGHELRKLVGVEEPKVKVPPPADQPRTAFARADGLKTSLQRWAWEERIPLGELTIAAGREKLGKSTSLVWVAARLTRGELPGYLEGAPCDVLFVSAEDHALRVLLPRLDLAGADREHVFLLDPLGPGFSARAVRDLEAGLGLIVLDPLSVFLDVPSSNEHGENATRRALLPFVELAQEYECALVGIRHFNKGSAKDNPFDVVMGSRAYSAAARSVLFFTPDREHKRAGGLIFAKGNLAADSDALRYRLDVHDVELDDGNVGPHPLFVEEGKATSITLEDALGSEEEATERGRAIEFLETVLADGPVPEKDVKRLATEEHIAERTLRRAKESLHVISNRVGGIGSAGWWEWSLPSKATT